MSPVTPPERLKRICKASQGFVYAVTGTRTTGGEVSIDRAVHNYLRRVREASPLPILAGFGIRRRDQVTEITQSCDGVVVGSALVERAGAGEDLRAFMESLRTPTLDFHPMNLKEMIRR